MANNISTPKYKNLFCQTPKNVGSYTWAFTVIVAYEYKRPLVTFRRIDSVLRNVPSGKARDTALFAGWNNHETPSYKVARISDSHSLTFFYNRASMNLRLGFL